MSGSPGLGVDERAVLDLVAGLFQEQHGFAQIAAHVVGAVVHRVGMHRGEHLGRHPVLNLVQDLELAALRQLGGRG